MSKKSTGQDITATIRRVRRSTRHGRKGLLFIAVDEHGREIRWWVRVE